MKIKKNDKVIVIAGKDKGKTGKVLKVFPNKNKVIVDGVNKKKKNKRPTRSDQKGQIIEIVFPVDASNVMLIDPKSGKRTRIGKKKVGNKWVRVTKKSGGIIK